MKNASPTHVSSKKRPLDENIKVDVPVAKRRGVVSTQFEYVKKKSWNALEIHNKLTHNTVI